MDLNSGDSIALAILFSIFTVLINRVAIELDGAPHFTPEGRIKDIKRDAYLKKQRISVLRFENKLIFENQSMVLDAILQTLLKE